MPKFFLTLKNIPEIKTIQDRYITTDNREKAIHGFAVRIAQRKYSKDKWRTKLDDVKKDIKSYVTLVTPIRENKMKKSELKNIIKEEYEKIIKEEHTNINQLRKQLTISMKDYINDLSEINDKFYGKQFQKFINKLSDIDQQIHSLIIKLDK